MRWFFVLLLVWGFAACESPGSSGGSSPGRAEPYRLKTFALEGAGSLVFEGVIDQSARTVAVEVPFGSELMGWKPRATHNAGAAVVRELGAQPTLVGLALEDLPAEGVDFASGMVVGLTGSGAEVDYTVQVSVARSSNASFSAFRVGDVDAVKVPLEDAFEVIVPRGTDLSSLVATFTVEGNAVVTVNGQSQTSGVTSQDFRNPVVYQVTAEDGTGATTTVRVSADAWETVNTALSLNDPISGFLLSSTGTRYLATGGTLRSTTGQDWTWSFQRPDPVLAADLSPTDVVWIAFRRTPFGTSVARYDATGAFVADGDPGFAGPEGSSVALSVRTGTPYVAIQQSGGLTVTKWTGTGWENLGTAGFTGPVTSYALAAGTQPWLAYTTAAGALKVVSYTDGGWEPTASDPAASGAAHVVMALGPEGRPWVAFWAGDGFLLRLQEWTGTSWKTAPLPETPAVDSLSLVVDPQGVVSLGYATRTTWQMAVVQGKGDQWTKLPDPDWGTSHAVALNLALGADGGLWAAVQHPGGDIQVRRMP